MQAGRLVVKGIEDAFRRREDFTYETTLTSHQSINVLKQAKDAGYQTLLIFIALSSADMHVARVAQRVRGGGHHIPEAVIRRRYNLAFDNLIKAIPLCEAVVIYDNSGPAGYRKLIGIEGEAITQNDIIAMNPFDRRIAACVAAGLNIPVESILPNQD